MCWGQACLLFSLSLSLEFFFSLSLSIGIEFRALANAKEACSSLAMPSARPDVNTKRKWRAWFWLEERGRFNGKDDIWGNSRVGQICPFRGKEEWKRRGCPWIKEHSQCQLGGWGWAVCSAEYMKVVRTKLGVYLECQAEALAEKREDIVRGSIKSSITLAAEISFISVCSHCLRSASSYGFSRLACSKASYLTSPFVYLP